MADADRETLELICDALLFWTRRGWGNWKLLIIDVSVLPDDLIHRFWSELYKTRDSGHAPEMFAAIKEYGVPPEPSALEEWKSKLRQLSPQEQAAADYLFLLRDDQKRPSHTQLGILAGVPKAKAKDTARNWPNQGMDAYTFVRRWPSVRSRSIAQLARDLVEPPGFETSLEFQRVAATVAQRPDITDEAAEEVTAVPASMIRLWRRLPGFGAAMAQQHPKAAET